MSHELLKLTQEIYSTPHLISLEHFTKIANYLDSRNTNLAAFPKLKEDAPKKDFLDKTAKMAVIPLMGATTYRETAISAMCGLTSYEGLLRQTQEAIDAGVTKVILHTDSGGGSAQGAFASANEFKQMCADAGITTYAYVDGSCCSAAYAWAAVCDVVVAEPYANVGSIGVLVAMSDTSEKDAKEGVRTVYVTDGTSKIPFDENGKFKAEYLKDVQDKVTFLGDEFRAHVSSHTGISTKTLKDTQAKVYMASDALELGLINKIMTKSEFISYVVEGKV